MTEGLYPSRAKLSTRLAFVAAGFGVACWAPLVPFAKTRCHLGDDTMGLVLLLLGAGSIVAMPLAANLSARFSSNRYFASCASAVPMPVVEESLMGVLSAKHAGCSVSALTRTFAAHECSVGDFISEDFQSPSRSAEIEKYCR